MRKLLFGAAIGAAAAWFLDPNDGTRRRNQTRDKAMKYARQGKGEAARQAGNAGSAIKGKASAASPSTSREPAADRLNDPALKDKVESEVFRAADAPKGPVSISVESAVVYLRGELDDREAIERLVAACAAVDGVRGVESLLHAPGEPAPAKEESHQTSSTSA